MINLMYIVLTAMLALNVSSDVLDGFTQVHEGLNRSNTNYGQRNNAIYGELESLAAKNPDKATAWLEKANAVRNRTAELYNYVDTLKQAIVEKADGDDANVFDIKNRDDLESAAVVMLAPGNPRGALLRNKIDDYCAFVTAFIPDTTKRATIAEALSTASVTRRGTLAPQAWEEAKFDRQPAVAAITLLTKLQNDIRYAEGEALLSIAALSQGKSIAEITGSEMIANELNAFVVPESKMVIRGGRYSADIVLAAVDTASRPTIYVGGRPIANGHYEFVAGSSGNFNYSGHIEVPHPDGSVTKHPFTSSYTVIDPYATVSATMMNVLYAGIDNPMSISVPGVHNSEVSASMTNGTLTRQGDHWVARPSKVGVEAVVTVTANVDGRQQTMATTKFRTRKLPDPTPYINITDAQGNPDRYRGGRPMAKSVLQSSPGIGAAIDDELLNIHFKVLSFQTMFFDSMGNAIPENSDGANFSARQKSQFQRLQRGKRFYITSVKAVGPDGITRDLSPLEVIIN